MKCDSKHVSAYFSKAAFAMLISPQLTKWRYSKLVILNTYLCSAFYVALFFYHGSLQCKISGKKLPCVFSVCVFVCVCVCVEGCQCHNGVAFVEGILILTTVEGSFKNVSGAPEIFNPDENLVLFIILYSDRM